MTAQAVARVALGSNLNEPVEQVIAGFEALSALPDTRLTARSTLYGSRPMGSAEQPDYVNAVACLETKLSAHELLDALQAIENRAGRDRSGPRWGSRTLDLDLLLHGDLQCDDERLTLPHPGIAERPFVLVPLAEIDPDLEIPGSGVTVAELARRADRSGLWPLEPVAS